jgi:hypothetical protein
MPRTLTVDEMFKISNIEAILNGPDSAAKAPKALLTEADFVFYRNHLLMEWEEQKRILEVAKESEMNLRKQVVAFAFDPEKKSGTENIDIGNGYKLKAVKKITYGWKKSADGTTVDKEAIEKALQKIEKTGPVGEHIAAKLVKWTPTLSKTEYDDLDEKLKKIIDEVIVTDEGAPTLEIVEPKAKK